MAMFLLMVWTIFPIFYLLLTSLKPQAIVLDVPPKVFFRPTIQEYIRLFQGDSFRYIGNSLIVSTIATILALIIGSLCAFSYTHFRFIGKEIIFFLIMLTRMYPPVTTLLPIYLVVSALRLADTKTILILMYISFQLPLVVWVMRSFFEEIPREIQESARLDGCSILDLFIRVVVPLASPGLVATGILTFVFNWNEFLFAFVLTSFQAKTSPVLIVNFIEQEQRLQWGALSSLGVVMIIPMFLFVFCLRRYLIKGLTVGALKG